MRYVLVLAALCACAPAVEPHEPSTERPAKASAASFTEGMKPSVPPGDDFYAYTNGGWIEKTEIPKDKSSWGITEESAEKTDQRNAELIKQAGTSGSPEAKKVATFYAAYMDEATIEAKGLAPLDETFAAIAAIKDKKDLAKVLGGTIRADVDILNNTKVHTANVLGLWVAEDLDDPKQYAAFLIQGGLGMPDRDYYLDAAPKMAELRTKYQAHIEAVLELAKVKDAKTRAARIFDLEKRMAQSHATREDAGNVEKGNNRWSRKDLDTKAPGLDWNAFLAAAKLDKQASFVVWSPKAVTGLAALVQSQSMETWKDYLQFRALDASLLFLPKAFVQEDFVFYGKAMNGAEQPRARWKNGIDATDDALGEAVGKMFVEKYFPASEKARAKQMVQTIITAFDKRIDALTWMTPATKAHAKAKLASLEVGVGYPDEFRDYSALEIEVGDAFGNTVRAEKFEYDRSIAKLGRPVDRGEWVMNPQLVNAVNLPVRNAIQFPAAILQPPFFDPNRPAALDYGYTGSTIGHEISHSFDDTGALFDETGRLKNWWTPEDLAHFKASGAALAAQFDAYKPFPDLSVNGKQTLGENIADVAGLAAAYDAYQISLGGKAAPVVGGFTGDQQFFIAYAQGWRTKERPEALRKQVVGNEHAPAEYRADSVRNLDAWYAAFAPKPGQALFLGANQRVRVW